VVADDHPAVLRSVCDILIDAGVDVVGRASNGEEAAAKIESTRPAVAVVDVRMPRMTGIEVAAQVSRTTPETQVILYTAYGDRALLSEALDAGVRGFVLKEAPLQDLTRAVDMVAGGAVYVDPVLAGVLASAESERLPQLTKREREMARLLVDTLSGPFEPERYPDAYRRKVEARLEGRSASVRSASPQPRTSPGVEGLMAALQASVNQARAEAKSKGRPAPRRKRKTA